MTSALVARLDNDGDVLLAGPAVRAVAAGADRVTLLCGPRGRQAAAMLPGVDEIVEYRAPWIDPDGHPVDRGATADLVGRIAAHAPARAMILTSFHQSALPTALLLRLAGVAEIAAVSEDYPGSLLDVRHHVDDDAHEVERGLSVVGSLGYRLPPGDDARLQVRLPLPGTVEPPFGGRYVVIHPGASVTARAYRPDGHARLVDELLGRGWRVAVTGAASEAGLTALVAGRAREGVRDLGGATTFAELAQVVAGAAAIVVGNTGPAHLAAAVGTPVVSLYAPTVPAVRWRPWRVPHVLLGRPVPCAGCRARDCPVAGHPCLDLSPGEIADALDSLVARVPLEVPA